MTNIKFTIVALLALGCSSHAYRAGYGEPEDGPIDSDGSGGALTVDADIADQDAYEIVPESAIRTCILAECPTCVRVVSTDACCQENEECGCKMTGSSGPCYP